MRKNFFYNSLYQVLILILPMITAPYVTRVLGAENLGNYAYTQSVAGYFLLFAMLGLNNYGNRAIARIRDDNKQLTKTFSEIVTMQWMTTIIVMLAYLFFMLFADSTKRIYYIILLLYVFSAGFDINWLFLGLEKFKINIVRNTIVKIATVVAIFLFVRKQEDILIYVLISSLGILIGQMCVWPYALKLVGFKRPKFNEIIIHIKPNFVLFIPVLAVSLYRVMDLIMIGIFCDVADVAYYSYSDKLIQIPLSLVIALTSVMMPRTTNLIAKGLFEKTKIMFDMAMQIVSYMCCAFAFGLFGIADVFIPLYYGESFSTSIVFLKYLSPIIIISGIAAVIRTQYLIPNNEDKKYLISVFGGAIINFVFNIIMLRMIGSIGAVYATIFAESVVLFIQIFTTHKKIDYKKYVLDIMVFIIIGLFMLFVIQNITMQSLVVCLITRVFIGCMVYVILSLIYLRLFRKNTVLYNNIKLLFDRVFLKNRLK